VIHAPAGSHTLYPGDKVLFFGPPDQIEGVRALIEAGHDHQDDEPGFTNVVLDTCMVGDAQTGKSLEHLYPDARSGIRVVGLQRGGERILTPSASERIRLRDQLLVLGTVGAIRRFRKSLLAPGVQAKDPISPATPPPHHA
jgi:CPA2 family monovalent cation:H+ antiporter-2